MMIGATPATFTNSGCTTPSAMPAATPASTALPPASKILKPASAARYWVAAIMWRVPMMVGRWAFMLSPVRQGFWLGCNDEWIATRHLAQDRAGEQPREFVATPSRGRPPRRATAERVAAQY